MKTFDEYVDSIVDATKWHSDLTDAEITAERDAMRVRVVEDLENHLPPAVLKRYRSQGVPG